ncbi:hypothetical protein K503DRAFT_730813 [Rhizopogon vinicolor AM-OR11-026]|uniref:Peptidase S9 prolyl oligopeptidase catalytic domain-containing protein n=1 Tax=Rhizopogon vinicolor AM-OR11-026 TaxID=1314800 RepID=A0A1B7NG23_9AGAM|nr:hypothetical protein K503DRAFT_730813 [Rhizopogon vinicolor AM-OR11-026]
MDCTSCTSEWRVVISQEWDVLGPFPIHAREQHFLSPAFPLDLSKSIDLNHTYSSAYADGGLVSWSKTDSDGHGNLKVSHPNIRWEQLRATEGWAALQHHNVLRTYFTLYPPDSEQKMTQEIDPRLRVECLQGAYFSILPGDETVWATHIPEWHMGNVYALERAPVQLVSLPTSPSRDRATRYQVVLGGPYEIRLFGDPRAYSSAHPILSINFTVAVDTSPPLGTSPRLAMPIVHASAHDVIPDFVDGKPFSRTLGIGLRNVDYIRSNETSKSGWWTIVSAKIPPCAGFGLAVSGLSTEMRLAPTQTHVLTLELAIDSEPVLVDITELPIDIIISPCLDGSPCNAVDERCMLRVNIPIRHIPMWTPTSYTAIRATYNVGFSNSTIFSVLPPRLPNDEGEGGPREPILALHGAGVDIVTQTFWADSLPRQDKAWVIIPSGRTSWGLDWHGPSAADAFTTVTALHSILCERFLNWVYPRDTKVIVMGHSNGGQGAWYIASRWPDKVKAVIAAAGYIKSQAYVPWTMSRFAHFIDPALRAVLETSLLPDDNDLFLSNLAHTPVLAIHGGMDDNVPPWHTREAVSVLREWNPDADVTYVEEPGQPHWWFEVLKNTRVQAFLDRVQCAPHNVPKTKCRKFTLTVAVPAESGAMRGWRVLALEVPGRLARLEVCEDDEGGMDVKASNISVVSVDLSKVSIDKLAICGHKVSVLHSSRNAGTLWFERATGDGLACWKAVYSYADTFLQPHGRAQAILSADGNIDIVIPSLNHSLELSVALRIAHSLRMFHLLDARISSASETENDLACGGNTIVIGCADSLLVKDLLERSQSDWSYEGGSWVLNDKKFDRPSSGLLFLLKKASTSNMVLLLQSTDSEGLERVLRLFPIRTGVLVPDWLVVDGRADRIGAAGIEGTGVWGSALRSNDGKWGFSACMSWLN